MSKADAAPDQALSSVKKKYKRILLKLSGEALMGNLQHGLDPVTISSITEDIKRVYNAGVSLCVVVGGGNIYRGVAGSKAQNIERATSDYMGMIATIINALALQSALENLGLQTIVQSAIPMDAVCEPYIRRKAVHHLEKGRIVIFAAGTGNPFFTTDTAAVLRASEMGCNLILKGTKVEGVYSEDPLKNKDAIHFEKLGYQDVLTQNLKVMDMAAIALAQDNHLPIVVFSILEKHGLLKALTGETKHTFVGNHKK
jgi:uridylate kinase